MSIFRTTPHHPDTIITAVPYRWGKTSRQNYFIQADDFMEGPEEMNVFRFKMSVKEDLSESETIEKP